MPEPLRGTGITLIVSGILALAFLGFSGMDKKIEQAIKGAPAGAASLQPGSGRDDAAAGERAGPVDESASVPAREAL